MEKENQKGREHPLSMVINEAVKIFTDLGFEVATGPELEDEWHNFDALNFPKDHPARDMQDTFFIKNKPGYVLRTHTSNTQIHFMEEFSKAKKTPLLQLLFLEKFFVMKRQMLDTKCNFIN